MDNDIVETTGTETPDMLASLAEIGCVAHRDDVDNCDRGASGRTWRAQGDLWCQTAHDEFGDLPEVVRIGEGGTELYGVTGADADWIRDNVGLN